MEQQIKGPCHFIGIGGIGMSALAKLLLMRHCDVSGSDISSNALTEELVHMGAKVSLGHAATHIKPQMTVIYSSSIRQDNPEWQAAQALGCRLMHRSELLHALMQQKKVLAITGTHGKTTTTGLLSWVLSQAGEDPSFAIGGVLTGSSVHAREGKGPHFVAEADESDGSFLRYAPQGAIVTNIGRDHMDYYVKEEALVTAFQTFIHKVSNPAWLFWCGDDKRLNHLNIEGVSYGFSPQCTWRIENVEQKAWLLTFDAVHDGKRYVGLELPLIGTHNALNGIAVFGLALALGISEEAIRKAFSSFPGVKRRGEKKIEVRNVLVIDDYAHHPTEIAATLKAMRLAAGERRLIVAFQPHRYSRTKDCLGTYGSLFSSVDEVIITEIYGAGEPSNGVSHAQVLEEVQQVGKTTCCHVPRAQLATYLAEHARPHDVIVSMGAGDITHLARELDVLWKKNPPKPWKVALVFGGKSQEHEISLLSSKHVNGALQRDLYAVDCFAIDKQGRWWEGKEAQQILTNKSQELPADRLPFTERLLQKLQECEVIFPVLHGPFGEDGTIQGFFEMLGKAYVGCGHLASALCMDKILTKQLMQANRVLTPPFVSFTQAQWREAAASWCQKIQTELSFPVFVKPVHLGSSIGVTKVRLPEELVLAIEEGFRYDTSLLVEQGIVGREIEFAVLGNDKVMAFPPGEILAEGKVYDYAAKYGPQSMPTTPAAELSPEEIAKGRVLAEKAYRLAGCKGMARVDFFLDCAGQFWLNEINPIPGFTSISLYPQICALHGLSSEELMDRLIILALERYRQQSRLVSSYDASI